MTAPRVVSAITVRRAKPGDTHDLYSMQEACLPSDSPADVSRGWWWVAEDEDCDDPVAFGGMYPSSQWGDAVYLVRSGVLPSHRGCGLQKRLIRSRLSYARRLGYRWAITETTFNPPSANSLIRCGFQTFTPSAPWSFKAAIYFRKQL